MAGLIQIAPPLVEPVSIGELKGFLHVDADDMDQDAELYALGLAARGWVEAYTGLRMVAQTWRLLMDWFPGYIDAKLTNARHVTPFVSGANAVLAGLRWAIELPYPPVRSMVMLDYLTQNGRATSLTAGLEYTADLSSEPARLVPPYGKFWPVAQVTANAVRADFVTGFAEDLTSVNMTAGSGVIDGYLFADTDIGCRVLVFGAGYNGGVLDTLILSVDTSGVGTAGVAATTVTDARGLVVNRGNATHFEFMRLGIRLLVSRWHEIRIPDESDIPAAVKAILRPIRNVAR